MKNASYMIAPGNRQYVCYCDVLYPWGSAYIEKHILNFKEMF